MTVTKVADAEKKERQQKQILVVLFSICILGFSYLIYDYFNIVDHPALPENFAEIDQTLQSWKKNGFVDQFEPAKAKLVVDEDTWAKLTKAQKVGYVTGLARFCAEGKKQQSWQFEVVGKRTSAVVGELGPNGLIVQ